MESLIEQFLSVHGFIYDIHDGQLHNLNVSISDADSAEAFIFQDTVVAKIDRGMG